MQSLKKRNGPIKIITLPTLTCVGECKCCKVIVQYGNISSTMLNLQILVAVGLENFKRISRKVTTRRVFARVPVAKLHSVSCLSVNCCKFVLQSFWYDFVDAGSQALKLTLYKVQ